MQIKGVEIFTAHFKTFPRARHSLQNRMKLFSVAKIFQNRIKFKVISSIHQI